MTARPVLAAPQPDDAEEMLDYYRRNRQHFQPWEPASHGNFYTGDGLRCAIRFVFDERGPHYLLRSSHRASV